MDWFFRPLLKIVDSHCLQDSLAIFASLLAFMKYCIDLSFAQYKQSHALPFQKHCVNMKICPGFGYFRLIGKASSYHTLPDSGKIECPLPVAPVKSLGLLRNRQSFNRKRSSAEYNSNVPYPCGAFHPKMLRLFANTLGTNLEWHG